MGKKSGPVFVNVEVDTVQEFEPKLKSKSSKNKIITPSLEDMFPFISEKRKYEVIKKFKDI